MEDNQFTVERIINSNYVRYNELTALTNLQFTGSKAQSINIYIDMYSLIKQLYHGKIYIQNYSVLTSCIINMCAHYREFFTTRYNVSTKFFIVFSRNDNEYYNKKFYGYNAKTLAKFQADKVMYDFIDSNCTLLETLCPYLPDIHFVKGTFETGCIILDIMCRQEAEGNFNPNIIITKDIYNYQLIGVKENTYILRPKKSEGSDLSYYINSNNCVLVYAQDRKVDIKELSNLNISHQLLSLIMTLSRMPERNIKALLNVPKTIEVVNKGINNSLISNQYNSDMNFVYNFLELDRLNIDLNIFLQRFSVIDIINQHGVFMNTPECKTYYDLSIKNLYDPETVKDINNQYFKKNPLDLNRI